MWMDPKKMMLLYILPYYDYHHLLLYLVYDSSSNQMLQIILSFVSTLIDSVLYDHMQLISVFYVLAFYP
jgi:hypothetical protein